MSERLYKANKQKVAAKANAAVQPRRIVLVCTYKDKQFAWIKKNGVYNHPVKDGDEFDADSFSKIKGLWLYAGTDGRRSCCAAEFAERMTQTEFVAAFPTYASHEIITGEMKWRLSA